MLWQKPSPDASSKKSKVPETQCYYFETHFVFDWHITPHPGPTFPHNFTSPIQVTISHHTMITSHDIWYHFTLLICNDILTITSWCQYLTTQCKVMYHFQDMIRLCDILMSYWDLELSWLNDVTSQRHSIMWLFSTHYESSWYDIMTWCHNIIFWRHDIKALYKVMWIFVNS